MKKLIISVAALTLAGASALSFAQGSASGSAASPGRSAATEPSTPMAMPMPSQASPNARQTPTPGAQTMTPSAPHSNSHAQKSRHTKKAPGNGSAGNDAANAADNAPGKVQ
ncbi:hypothetical protein PHO31112_00184 [Pandoraea horticolens]|uniref:Proteophosphoglycan ppg4 n=1 Tax=Pandoraea horticolens TaxID=2508298 RepID=A0A5E4RI17_9BURK|nr:hypothetical protein [Pandoraea horticolens]VVD62503.1 hypothetical protein PHO31112_00184 [Pandoraea horticolens]